MAEHAEIVSLVEMEAFDHDQLIWNQAEKEFEMKQWKQRVEMCLGEQRLLNENVKRRSLKSKVGTVEYLLTHKH